MKPKKSRSNKATGRATRSPEIPPASSNPVRTTRRPAALSSKKSLRKNATPDEAPARATPSPAPAEMTTKSEAAPVPRRTSTRKPPAKKKPSRAIRSAGDTSKAKSRRVKKAELPRITSTSATAQLLEREILSPAMPSESAPLKPLEIPEPALAAQAGSSEAAPATIASQLRILEPSETVPASVPVAEFETSLAELGVKVPAILLEGDEPGHIEPSGPGQKFALGSTSGLEIEPSEEGELPDAYGTGRFFLVARDPHCLYAHWDLTLEQQQRYNGLSTHRHLVVRIYLESQTGQQVSELHVHPESRHWFIPVDRPGLRYVAELGYYQSEGRWKTIAVSGPVQTPVMAPAESGPVEFATIPAPAEPRRVDSPRTLGISSGPSTPPPPPKTSSIGFQAFPEMERPRPENQFFAATGAGAELPAPASEPGLHAPFRYPSGVPDQIPVWTPAQERALEEFISWSQGRKEWIGSAELAELVRLGVARAVPQQISSIELQQMPKPTPSSISLEFQSPTESLGIFSQAGGEVGVSRGFWFNVNAELVIYGATEPDAAVTIGGRTIRLRPDGTFSYRFALPDGEYALPVVASASDGDQRRAELKFYRGTRYEGEVGAHPQDPSLKQPSAENVS